MTSHPKHDVAEHDEPTVIRANQENADSTRASYLARAKAHAASQARFEAQARVLSMFLLGTFVAVVALVGLGLYHRDGGFLLGGAVALFIYGVLFVRQGKLNALIDDARVREQWNQSRLAIMDGAPVTRDYSRFAPSDHSYAYDLDLVGERSLVARFDITRSVRGAKKLLGWLLDLPNKKDAIEQRQAQVKELSRLGPFREDLACLLGGGQVSPERPTLYALHSSKLQASKVLLDFSDLEKLCADQTSRSPSWTSTLRFLPLLWIVPIFLPQAAPVVLLLMIAVMLGRGRYHEVLFAKLTSSGASLEGLSVLLSRIESASFESTELREVSTALHRDDASRELAALARLVNVWSYRMQGLFGIFANLVLLWDLQFSTRVEGWLTRRRHTVQDWLDHLAVIESVASLSMVLAEDPDATMPEVGASGLEVVGLVHPLVSAQNRVANNLSLQGPGALGVITGSNMAGKSTLLRSTGISLALGLAGGPVFARSAKLPLVELRTSMRVLDSIQEGASYFRAELNRLGTVLAPSELPVFFLLDELLRGTNAEARTLGALGIVKKLLAGGGFGLLATHDPALCDLAVGEDRFNAHFAEQMKGGEMSFDYHLRPGPAHGGNALRLLAQLGVLDVNSP